MLLMPSLCTSRFDDVTLFVSFNVITDVMKYDIGKRTPTAFIDLTEIILYTDHHQTLGKVNINGVKYA